jgi:predicted dehydrogenase
MTLGILYESVARWLGHATDVAATLRNFAPVQAGPGGAAIVADVPDVAAVIAGFPGGVVATFAIAGYGRPDPVNGATLVGTGGVLRVDLAGSRLELAPAGAAAFDDVAIPDAERWTWRVEADFIGAIRDAEPVRLTDFATGVRYMRFTDTVHEAAATGTRVAL